MRVAAKNFHQSIFSYRQYRYAWWSLGLALLSWAVYLLPTTGQPANGGTWQGYTLGSLGAALIMWLLWLGIRKRRYARGSGTVQGWVSAHVYMGLALLWIATLHSAFQFGWNLHTLAYSLMVLVIASGLFGVWGYAFVPVKMAANRDQKTRDELLALIAEVDRQCVKLARNVDAGVVNLVQSALDRTVLGGGMFRQLSGRDYSSLEVNATKQATTSQNVIRNNNQQQVISRLAERLAKSRGGQETVYLQELLWLFARRKTLLQKIRSDVRWQGWLKVWLAVHVPISLALLVALILHIFSVFYYW